VRLELDGEVLVELADQVEVGSDREKGVMTS
jgi:hypothetical protein